MGDTCSKRAPQQSQQQQGIEPPVVTLMQTMADRDGSGNIDPEEFRKHVSPTKDWPNSDSAFDRADADGNGLLTPNEIAASFGVNTSAWPGLQDALQDGSWTKDDLRRFLVAADADDDGVVSTSECLNLHQHLDQNSDGRVSADELQDTFRLFDAQAAFWDVGKRGVYLHA